ncbi:hypothetical protein CTAYLR_002797 [Chrysophaeum taylorii]|uniref:dTMP kinase n=1 Tax=Chrysophaeum taylorii TaxID=2483200 RepID=A0AAD7U9K8_9STRA|nr:hypothetical protein CTAYLR_002797 [Chrysophaeum taylorii]
MADDWIEDFERVKRASLFAQAHAVEELDRALQPMEKNPSDYKITKREADRRRVALEALRDQCTRQTPTSEGARAIGARIHNQKKLLKQQDSAISDIRKGVDKISELGYQLRDETHLQVGLLDSLHADVEEADDAVRRETRRAQGFLAEPGDCSFGVTNLFTSLEEAANVVSCAVSVIGELKPHAAAVRGLLATPPAGHARVVVVEGLDGSGKSTLARRLADDLGATAAKTPPASMDASREAFDRVGGPAARAYYAVSNYAFARELKPEGLVVCDRWYGSTIAYTVGQDGRDISSFDASVFRWPRDLPRPALVLLLRVSEDVRARRVAARRSSTTWNPWDDRLRRDPALGRRIFEALRRLDVPVVEIDADQDADGVLRDARRLVRNLVLEDCATPLGELRRRAARLGLCDVATGRRNNGVSWTCALFVGGRLRFVSVAGVDDFGIYLLAAGGEDLEKARVALLQGEAPFEEEWRAQNGVLRRLTRAEFEIFCGSQLEALELFSRFVPSSLDLLVGGSLGASRRTRWERDDTTQRCWHPPVEISPFYEEQPTVDRPLVVPAITLVLILLAGTTTLDAVGTSQVARTLGWRFDEMNNLAADSLPPPPDHASRVVEFCLRSDDDDDVLATCLENMIASRTPLLVVDERPDNEDDHQPFDAISTLLGDHRVPRMEGQITVRTVVDFVRQHAPLA